MMFSAKEKRRYLLSWTRLLTVTPGFDGSAAATAIADVEVAKAALEASVDEASEQFHWAPGVYGGTAGNLTPATISMGATPYGVALIIPERS